MLIFVGKARKEEPMMAGTPCGSEMVRGAFVSARVRFVRGLFAPRDESPPRAIIEGNFGKEYQAAW